MGRNQTLSCAVKNLHELFLLRHVLDWGEKENKRFHFKKKKKITIEAKKSNDATLNLKMKKKKKDVVLHT